MRLAALRRALLPTVVAAALVSVAPAAGAQTASILYAPSCGPGTPCSLLRVHIGNEGSSTLLFNAMTLAGTSGTYTFAPTGGGVALYQAVDAVGPFGGSGTVSPGGSQLFIDVLGGNGFAFELAPGARGYVEVALSGTPALADGAFTISATMAGGGTFTRSLNVVPEPATVTLVGGGLALLGLAARRRRRVEAAA